MGFHLIDFVSKLTQKPFPNAKPLPEHVRKLKLDHKLLLHMAGADKQSPNTQVGHVKQ